MPKIEIMQWGTWKEYTFDVADPDNLTRVEVNRICNKMFNNKIMVNGKYYECTAPLVREKLLKEWRKPLAKGIYYRRRMR